MGMKLKGVILAGGTGSRLMPMTKSVNKHLLPVGGKPMLQHCVEKVRGMGIDEIMVVTGGEHLGGIAEFLGGGDEYGCEFHYRVQDKPGGIAQALWLAKSFVGKDNVFVLLGDNIFEDDTASMRIAYEAAGKPLGLISAMVVLKKVDDPERFGVATVDRDGGWRVTEIIEKPKRPKSDFAVTGLYFYGPEVFDIIGTLKPSGRGELEITDVNNEYIRRGAMSCYMMKGWWTDAGTHESYRKANELVLGS
jgi:glucose-1-phosphate thymidylyltransferase